MIIYRQTQYSLKSDDWDEEDESHFKNLEDRRKKLKSQTSLARAVSTALCGSTGAMAGFKDNPNHYNKKHGITGALVGAGVGFGLGHLIKKVSDRHTDKEIDRQKDEYRNVSDKDIRRMRGLELRMKNDRKDNPNIVYIY